MPKLATNKKGTSMAKTKRMDQIKIILRTYLQCKTIKGTARRLGVSKNTVRQYLQFAQAIDADLEQVLLLPIFPQGEPSVTR